MPILDAALAFALTMLVVATVVSKVVEFMQYLAKTRSKELQKMVTEYFATEFQPVLEREFARLKRDTTEQFTKRLLATTEIPFKLEDDKKLFGQKDLAALVTVSTEEFLEELKRSKFGKGLFAELSNEAQTVFDELGRRYEVIGDKFTASFRKHTRWWTTLLALVLALALNIDSIHIANSYIQNAQLRESIIAQQDAILEMGAASSDANQPHPAGTSANHQNQSTPIDSTNRPIGQAQRDTIEAENKPLQDAGVNAPIAKVGTLKEAFGFLTEKNFPVGWSQFPHVGLQDLAAKDFKKKNNFLGWLLWLLGIVLTAGLAGRGAPFWYDTVTGISRLTQKARTAKKS